MISSFFAFASTFLIPIPYLGFGALLGFFLIFNIKRKELTILFPIGLGIVSILSLVFLSNVYNSVTLNYNEIKNLVVLIASFLYFVYFNHLFFAKRIESGKRNKILIYIAGGELVASFIFWRLPPSLLYKDYTWFKYRGGYSLILIIFQIFVVTKYRNRISANLLLGLSLFFFSFSQNAKSIALLVLVVTIFRVLLLSSMGNRHPLQESKSSFRLNFFKISIPSVIFILLFQRLVELGIFGERLKSFGTEYGGSLILSIFQARAEFPLSMQILKQMSFFGYGTISDPLNHLNIDISVSNHMSYGSQKYFILRTLGDGFDLHSWAFNLIVRAGFLVIIPIALYLAMLIRCAINMDLLTEYPGLYFIVLTCIVDLFFSPYSWFVPIQIALSFLSYRCITEPKITGNSV